MDNIKAFLEADALRTQGKWFWSARTLRTETYEDDDSPPQHTDILRVDQDRCIFGRDADMNLIEAASRIAPDLAKMVEDMRMAREALESVLDEDEGYFARQELVRQALTRLKPCEKLFEKEGEVK